MHLVRDDIVTLLASVSGMANAADPELLRGTAYGHDLIDQLAAYEIAKDAQTIVLDSAIVADVVPALDRFSHDEDLEYRLPFQDIVVQLTQPILEREIFDTEPAVGMELYTTEAETTIAGLFGQRWVDAMREARQGRDRLTAVLLSQREDAGVTYNNAVAFFASGAVNRVAWKNQVGARLKLDELAPQRGEESTRNKYTLQKLAIALVNLVNAENVTLCRTAPSDKVNRKRQKHGKQPLPAYYTCYIRKSAYEPQGSTGEASGRHVGRLFPVRGHFRRLPSGAVTWVRAHYRGLAHAENSQVPKVYKLDR